MTIDNTDRAVGLILSLAALGALLVGYVRWLRPRWRTFWREIRAIRDALLGREAITDSITGDERVPALPGLGVRMASVEENQTRITEALVKLADSHELIQDHENRIKALEAAAVERVVTKVESAQAWRTIEKAIDAEPSEAPDLD